MHDLQDRQLQGHIDISLDREVEDKNLNINGNYIVGDGVGGDKVEGDKIGGHKLTVERLYLNADAAPDEAEFLSVTISGDQTVVVKQQFIEQFVKQLYENHLIIVEKHSSIHVETIVRQITQTFYRLYNDLSLWQWSDGDEPPDLKSHFSVEDAIQRESGIYQCFNIAHDIIDDLDLPNLRRKLELHNQYIILTTSSPHDASVIKSTYSKLWCTLPEDGYALEYLANELALALENLKNLSDTDRFMLQAERKISGIDVQKIAGELGSLSNIDVFVAYLGTYQELDEKLINNLVKQTQNQNFDKKIYYLYERLDGEHQKLLAGGLCLFGGLVDELFFSSLQKVVSGPWHHIFHDIVILDYFHLEPLHSFITYHENKIKHRHSTAQFEPLFLKVWKDYQYHIRAAVPILMQITNESVQRIGVRAKTDIERQQHRDLRYTTSKVLSLMGILSPQSVEHPLTELATDTNWGLQTTAARAVAYWYKTGELGKIQSINFLTNWQLYISHQGPEYVALQKNISSTIIWALSYILHEEQGATLCDSLIHLVFRMLVCPYEDLRSRAQTSLLPKLFSTDIEPLIQALTTSNIFNRNNIEQHSYLSGIIVLSQAFEQRGHLIDISGWLVIELEQSVKESYLSSFEVLTNEQLDWLTEKILIPYIEQSTYLILLLIQIERFRTVVFSTLKTKFGGDQDNLLYILSQWYQQYEQDLFIDERNKVEFWSHLLPSIGMIFKFVDKFDEYEKWIDLWLQERKSFQLWEIANSLVEVDRHLTNLSNDTKELLPFCDSTVTFSFVEKSVLSYIIAEQTNPFSHKIFLYFYCSRFGSHMATLIESNLLRNISSITLYTVAPFDTKVRKKLSDLFPVADAIFQKDRSTFEKIIHRLKRAQNTEIANVAVKLNRTVRWSQTQNCLVGIFQAIMIFPVALLLAVGKSFVDVLLNIPWRTVKRYLK